MKRSLLRPVAVGIATLSTVATMAIGAVSSHAATIGTLTFTPATGVDTSSMTVSTSAPCNDGTTNFQLVVTGAGFPAAGVNVTPNEPQNILPANAAGGFDASLQNTMQSFANAQTPPAVLSGDYVFSGNCRNTFGAAAVDSFVGTVTFTQHAGGSPTYTSAVATVNVDTTTSLASTPASPVNTGVPVAFTAHVAANTGTATPAGTVQLMDGATAVGSPTAIDGSGNVTISTSFTTTGSHVVTAAFTGGAGFNNSVSTGLTYTVNAAPASDTATSLSISPASATSVDPVTLTAAVADVPTPATIPTGSVQFADGGTNIGSPVALSAGTAALTQTFPAGPHSFTATYIPSNAAIFNASSSTSQAYTVTTFAGVSASETIETTVLAGALTISVADTSTVVLPSPVLNATATFLTTSGRIHAVTVSDTRAGNPGWNLSGQVSDFQNTTGPTTTPIAGVNLGWTPNVIDQNPGQTVVAGPIVLPQTPPLAADPAVATAAGLHVSRLLASAAAGAGTGTSHVDALLALNVPTTVIAGTYDATLTLTAI
jgi:hypothetical protein